MIHSADFPSTFVPSSKMAFQRFESKRYNTQSSKPKEILPYAYPNLENGMRSKCVCIVRLLIRCCRLQEKVIDLEVENAAPSPTVDPSVRTILIGHSMGGIVAADTALLITSDQIIDPPDSKESESHQIGSLMFPYIQGVLAFDTPYLGISPGVVAHGAEGHYNTASAAFTQLSSLTSAIWGTNVATDLAKEAKKEPVAALPAPPAKEQPVSAWAKWGKIAAAAGGVAAVAGAGTAAFVNRDKITEGWSWVGSHLEFVGCLSIYPLSLFTSRSLPRFCSVLLPELSFIFLASKSLKKNAY